MVLKRFLRMKEARKIFKNSSRISKNGIYPKENLSLNHKDHSILTFNGIAERRNRLELKARSKSRN